jgi:hypothetical protein
MSSECGRDGKEETGRNRQTRMTRAYEAGRHRHAIAACIETLERLEIMAR